jgi:multidrug resistance efflux pump
VEFDTAEHSLALVQAKATLSSLETQAEILHQRGDAGQAAEVDKKVAAARERVEDVLGRIAAGTVRAGTAGRVLHVGVSQADRVARGQALCLVAPQDQLFAMGNVSGWTDAPFQVGQPGRVVLVSDPSAAVDARVTAVRKMEFGENAWEVKLRLLSPGPFQPGMTAQARLTIEKVQP